MYADNFKSVAASQTASTLTQGGSGVAGDYLDGLLVVPATVDPGAIAILDGSTSYTVFTGGTASVVSLVPFVIPWGSTSKTGAWKVTTGAAVSVVAFGRF